MGGVYFVIDATVQMFHVIYLQWTHHAFVSEEKFITDGNIVEAREAAEEDLLVVHTKRYLNRLKVTLFFLNAAIL